MTIELDTVYQLLSHLYRGGQHAYFWTVTKDKREKISYWFRCDDLPDPPRDNGRHVYFAVAPVAAIPTERFDKRTGELIKPPRERIRSENKEIVAVNAIYGDFDAKDFGGDKAAALAHIESLTLQPNILTDSGGGFQAFWLLDVPLFIDSRETRERATTLQERWVEFVGADKSVHDLCRVLRVPGTRNWKYNPAPTCDFVYADFDHCYAVEILERALPVIEAKEAPEPITPQPKRVYSDTDHIRRWVDGRIARATEMVQYAAAGDGSMSRFRAGKLLGGLVHLNVYTESELVQTILPAALQRSSDDPRETERNIWNGFREGTKEPLDPPDNLPTSMPLIVLGNKALCPSCDTQVRKSKYDYPGSNEPAWYCPDCKSAMKWPADAFSPKSSRRDERDDDDLDSEGEADDGDSDETPRKRGRPKKQRTLSSRILEWFEEMEWDFELNEMGSLILWNGKRRDDFNWSLIRVAYQDAGYTNMALLDDMVRIQAKRNEFHPIKRYLEGLQWDGVKRIHKVADYLKSPDAPIVYTEEKRSEPVLAVYLKRWMIGSIAKIYQRAQNSMLVLGGPQDIGKSHFVRWLCPIEELFIENLIEPHDKDAVLRFATHWIWHADEVDGTTRRSDRAALKAALTRDTIILRKAYDRFDTKTYATASFIGTLNPDNAGFLDDPTGSRRYWVVDVEGVDWSYDKDLDIHQIWAEAFALYKAGEPWRLLPDEVVHREMLNSAHNVEDPTLAFLERYLTLNADPSCRMSGADIILHLKAQEVPLNYNNTRGLSMDIARALKSAGVGKVGTGSTRVYVGVCPRSSTSKNDD